ncbi:B12-binding domain-containing protein [Hasllibacter sp. MH4015]|uniref:cobalamin B12-binding domain-containing protein n=1 Tax=Hasllibacter sp. MH4015 TaxID=2854029 RepID=UPI001CD2BBE1|nr:cobalamin B12-binding domain-containing protein [Hasllibacter sp. MH4015]
MADGDSNNLYESAGTVRGDVRDLARHAIRILVRGDSTPENTLTRRMHALSDLYLGWDPQLWRDAIHDLQRDGFTKNEIVDHILPEVARILGQRWADDTLSFADVSIGTARVQQSVRQIAKREVRAPVTGKAAKVPRLLLVIPRGEDHTLGIFVAADKFRRFGYDVDIAIDDHPRDIAAMMREGRYCMVGLTVSGRRTLASAREVVEIIRSTAKVAPPIVLGGTLLSENEDLKAATGVDHLAQDAKDALSACGLDIVEADPPLRSMSVHAK